MVTPLTTCCRTTAVTLRGGRTSREAEVGHGAAAGHGHRVELEVELLAQIEGHLLGALRFHHPAILPEDHVLEFLENAVGLLEVVVLADQAVAAAAVGRHGLGDEEIEELLASAPV